MTMRRSFWGVGTGLLIGVAVFSGCGQDLFGPPSRTKPEVIEATPEPQSSIFMIVPRPPANELEVWGLIGQREANLRRVIFRIMGPGPNDSPAMQTEVVRRALNDGASALIVVPGSAPDLPQILAEAEAKKVPVVLLGEEIQPPAGSPHFTVAMIEPFAVSSAKIVAAVIEDAKKAGKPIDGPTLLVTDQNQSFYAAERLVALKAEAEKAGLKNIVTVPFDGANADNAKNAVLEAIKAHPDTAIVLAEDVGALQGAAQARGKLGGKAVFFVGGYAGFRGAVNSNAFMNESCMVDGRLEDLAKLAVLTAIDRIKGAPGGERAIQVPKFSRGTGEIATEDTGLHKPGDPRHPRKVASPPPPSDPDPTNRKP